MHKQPRWFWLVLWLWPLTAHAQDVFTLTTASLQNGQAVELDKLGWKYSPSDDPRFADPQFDDRAWEMLNGTAITLNSIPKSGWHGSGWFRLRLKTDPALANQPLALVMVQFGASEIYLDGKLVQQFGKVGVGAETEVEFNPNTQPLGLLLNENNDHVIVVRHSCLAMRDMSRGWGRWLARLSNRPFLSNSTNHTNEFGAGFGLRLQELKQAQAEIDLLKSPFKSGFYLLASGLSLSGGLLYLLLFWFYPLQRGNLYFGLNCIFGFIQLIARYLLTTAHYGASGTSFLYVFNVIALYASLVLLLAFLYTAFLRQLPKYFWGWVLMGLLFIVAALFNLHRLSAYIFTGIVFLEVTRLVISSIVKKLDGAWIIGLGLLISVLLIWAASSFGQTGSQLPISLIASLCSVLPSSIFLARQFARTSLNLEAQLVQVKQLSAAALEHEKVKAEHDRKTKELEDARQLQLSMLPKKLPQLPHLDIAAYMKTASEVGGDYYDFHLGEDGTLTIAVGDATGHGLKAGTMVASVKSLFVSLADHPDIPLILTRLSQTLKQMNLRGLFMALTIAKIKENRLTISLAGMPPVWLYRAATQQVEDIALQQLPLGGVTKYVYQQREYELAAGDVIVLLSDGLPERFNPAGALLEDEAAKQWLTEHAQLPAHALLEGLAKLGDDWGGARPQDDDVTLVVLKVK